MAICNTLDDVLESFGWTTALIEAEVASSGTTDSYLKAAHLTRTRCTHKITLLTLYNLQSEAFMLSEGLKMESLPRLGETTCRREVLLLCTGTWSWDMNPHSYLHQGSQREEFPFLCWSLGGTHTTPLFFALEHVNYSRWMPVHIRDMKSLPDTIKDEFEIFLTGSFPRQVTNSLQSHLIKLMSRRTRLRKVLVEELLDSHKALWVFDDGCFRDQRCPGCWGNSKKNTLLMMTQKSQRTSSIMSWFS